MQILRTDRIGEERHNNAGDLMKIIAYDGVNDMLVEFQDEHKYKTKAQYDNFVRGTIKNPYHPLLYGRGYFGVGPYRANVNKRSTKAYDAWRQMFKRCYGEAQESAYSGCEVCVEWYDYQTFAKWFTAHYWEDAQYRMQVDKDWLVSGNKVYSPDRCEIVPSIINACLLRQKKTKYYTNALNIDYTASGKYSPILSKYGRPVYLGLFDTIDEATAVYKAEKVSYVRELANRYKENLSARLYDAMMNYDKRLEEEFSKHAELCNLPSSHDGFAS